jgi:hypothetical protein
VWGGGRGLVAVREYSLSAATGANHGAQMGGQPDGWSVSAHPRASDYTPPPLTQGLEIQAVRRALLAARHVPPGARAMRLRAGMDGPVVHAARRAVLFAPTADGTHGIRSYKSTAELMSQLNKYADFAVL